MKKYIFTLSALVYCACSSTNLAYTSQAKKPSTYNNCQDVVYMQPSLNNSLACSENLSYSNGNLLIANITLTNVKGSNKKLKLAIDWFDEYNNHIHTQKLIREEVNIQKNDVKYLRYSAPSINAKYFKLRIYQL